MATLFEREIRPVDAKQLQDALNASGTIAAKCISVSVDSASVVGNNINVIWDADLNTAETTAQDTIILNHVPVIKDYSTVGQVYKTVFGSWGRITRPKWLVHNGVWGIASNSMPHVVLWDTKIVGMSFVNKKETVDIDIDIYISNRGDGITTKTKIYTWQVRDTRTSINNSLPDIYLESGDKIALFVSSPTVGAAKQAQYPSIEMFLQVYNGIEPNIIDEDYTGDMRSN